MITYLAMSFVISEAEVTDKPPRTRDTPVRDLLPKIFMRPQITG